MAWESEVRKYEDATGDHFPETSKMGAILAMVPTEVSTYLRLNPEKAQNYLQVRQLVFQYAQAKEDENPAPTDLGSFS